MPFCLQPKGGHNPELERERLLDYLKAGASLETASHPYYGTIYDLNPEAE